MREVLVLTLVIFAADGSEETQPTNSISANYSKIVADYDDAIADAKAKNSPNDVLLRIGMIRQNAFRRLVATGAEEREKLAAADLAALAMASEYLFERDDCIRYASRSIQLDPQKKDAYIPLIRSLLNGNQIDEAEAVIASAESQVNDGTRWHGMHYFVFVKCREDRQWSKAEFHLEIVLDALLLHGGSKAAETKRAVKFLPDFKTTARHAGLEAYGDRKIRQWMRECSETLERKIGSDTIANVEQLKHCAALCEVQCEISNLLPDLSYDGRLLFWAKVVFSPRWMACEAAAQEQQKYFGRYFQSNASRVTSWAKVTAGLSQLWNDDFADEKARRSNTTMTIFQRIQTIADKFAESEPVSALDAAPF